HNHYKIVPLTAGLRDPPRRIQSTRIAVQQKRHHHPRVKRRLPKPAHIAARDRPEIEALPHQLNDKPRNMAFRHKILHIRRQKQRLIDIPGAKILAHGPRLNQNRLELNSHYSDRLLENAGEILSRSSQGVIVVDNKGQPTFLNRPAEAMVAKADGFTIRDREL